jgi:hypothetical protein
VAAGGERHRFDQQRQGAVANPVVHLLLRHQRQIKTRKRVVDRVHDLGRGLHQRAIQVKHDQIKLAHETTEP